MDQNEARIKTDVSAILGEFILICCVFISVGVSRLL